MRQLVDSRDLAVANYFILGMAGIFAVFIACFGDILTSKQWVYLMSVPGGKWSWAVTFGALAIYTEAGMMRQRHVQKAAGCFGIGLFSTFVAVCYLLAPLQDSGLKTGGWWPWIVSGAACFAVGAVNTRDHQ